MVRVMVGAMTNFPLLRIAAQAANSGYAAIKKHIKEICKKLLALMVAYGNMV